MYNIETTHIIIRWSSLAAHVSMWMSRSMDQLIVDSYIPDTSGHWHSCPGMFIMSSSVGMTLTWMVMMMEMMMGMMMISWWLWMTVAGSVSKSQCTLGTNLTPAAPQSVSSFLHGSLHPATLVLSHVLQLQLVPTRNVDEDLSNISFIPLLSWM